MLDIKQISAAARRARRDRRCRPTSGSFIVRDGTSEAFEGAPTLVYDEDADTITDTTSDTVYTAEQQGDREFFVDETGERLSDQSWTANVGTAQLRADLHRQPDQQQLLRHLRLDRHLRDPVGRRRRSCSGLLFAITLNDPRVRGQKIYRALLILPYAIPGFISLLLWSSFYNQDFGLINDITGLEHQLVRRRR